MSQRRRDKKQRKLTQQNTAAIYSTSGHSHAAQTQQMAMQQEQLRIAQMQAAEAQAAAALAQQEASQRAGQIAATAMDAAQWHPDPLERHELRYWDGSDWTDSVSDEGVVSSDPIEQPALSPGDEMLAIESSSEPDNATLVNQFRELAELRDQGILTEDEFAAQKAKLLGSSSGAYSQPSRRAAP